MGAGRHAHCTIIARQMDFSRVLVTDNLAWQLFSAANREKLLFSRLSKEKDLPTLSKGGGPARQRALTLLLLFDHLVLHDYNDTFRLPDLERDGIVEVVQSSGPVENVAPLPTRWRRGPLAHRGRPPRALLKSLALVQRLQPFVVNRVLPMTGEIKFFPALAKGLRVSRRRCVELFLDYALAAVRGDQVALREHVFTTELPEDFLREITDGLFHFNEQLDAGNSLIFAAMLAADQIATIQSLSARLGLGVATEHYGEVFRPETALVGIELDAVAAANKFLTLRAALVEEGGLLPRIDCIKDALALRKDPRLRAVREQLAILHGGLTTGDREAISDARREIRKARQALRRRAAWDKALRWVAYLSVPVGVAEILSGTPPIVGTSIAVVGAAGTAGSRKVERDNEWVLFGT